MEERDSVSFSLLNQLIQYLETKNIDVHKILEILKLNIDFDNPIDMRIPIENYLAIENYALEIIGDPCLGLHMGEQFQTGNWSIMGYLMMNCKTLGQAFEKSAKYGKIVSTIIEAKPILELKGIKVIFFQQPFMKQLPRHCFESTMVSTVTACRKLSGQNISPIEVGFEFDEPQHQYLPEYHRIFGCPIKFNQKHNYLLLSYKLASVPVLSPCPGLLNYFAEIADNMLIDLEAINPYTKLTVRYILNNIDNGKVNINQAARVLSMSVRTLQNKLKDENTDFSKLQQEVKLYLAKKSIDEGVSIEEITYMLGFSESSAFRKAFKIWTGLTPREYRINRSS